MLGYISCILTQNVKEPAEYCDTVLHLNYFLSRFRLIVRSDIPHGDNYTSVWYALAEQPHDFLTVSLKLCLNKNPVNFYLFQVNNRNSRRASVVAIMHFFMFFQLLQKTCSNSALPFNLLEFIYKVLYTRFSKISYYYIFNLKLFFLFIYLLVSVAAADLLVYTTHPFLHWSLITYPILTETRVCYCCHYEFFSNFRTAALYLNPTKNVWNMTEQVAIKICSPNYDRFRKFLERY